MTGNLTSALRDAPARANRSVSIVIATRNRPQAIRDCLDSINRQTVLPEQVVVVDSSPSPETRDVISSLQGALSFPCEYLFSTLASAAQQRNLGAEMSHGEIFLFLDDDVILEPDCIQEILYVFDTRDDDRTLGGVGGAISNQPYTDPKGINRFLLGLCLGQFNGSFAGKVLGPAVNFLPADGPSLIQQTEWLPSTCVAYRKDVFLANRFEDTFEGYSFAEDLHLSTRVALSHRLLNTTRARVYHSDLGKDTHRNWAALGESQVRNRGLVMRSVLKRNRLIDHLRLFAYEMLYVPITWLYAGLKFDKLVTLGSLLRGKIRGFAKFWGGRS